MASDPPGKAKPEDLDVDELPSEFTPPAKEEGPSLEDQIAALVSLDGEVEEEKK
jgi:hypothetical protein